MPDRVLRTFVPRLRTLFILALLIVAVLSVQAAEPPSKAAETYYQWILTCINGIDKDVPGMVKGAEAAAKRYCTEDNLISAMGDKGFGGEISGRAGGLMWMKGGVPIPGKSIVLYAIREDQLSEAVSKVTEIHKGGNLVIVFARKELIDKAKSAGAQWDYAVNTHGAENGALFQDSDGKWIVPTDSTAATIAEWVWVGEFVSACTRLGKMPTIYQAYHVPGGMDRAKRVGGMKFHPETPIPSAAADFGHEYLRRLKQDLALVHIEEMENLHKVATLAVSAKAAGKNIYAFVHGHCAMEHLGYPHDPGYFPQLNDGWFAQKKDITLHPGDFVFCVGFNQIFQGWQFKTWTDDARKSGATLAWSITGYRKSNKVDGAGAILPTEILVDQHWDLGDSVVYVPGYDIPILPTSGVLAEAILWMTNADVYGQLPGGKL